MTFFETGAFWFLEGILFCLALWGIRAWAQDSGVAVPPWKWALVATWMLYCGFTLSFIGTCLGEKERHAALLGGSIFGLIAVVGGVGLYRVLGSARQSAERPLDDA
jgi:hypothetical protein